MTDDWSPRLASMVAELVAAGDISTPAWEQAFSRVPRHVFVPAVILSATDGYRTLRGDRPQDREEWLTLVHSDTSLVTQAQPHGAGYRLPTGQPVEVSTSSSTMPGLMARMLEALDVHDGHRVLEIGTGSGYNAALLCERLGSDHVTSIDIDPQLVGLAEKRLAGLGYNPTLVAGDGAAGVPGRRYDRIIATAAVPDIPPAWIQQLAPSGKILANLRGDLSGANLCLLTKDGDDEVIGPILPLGGHFMWLRPTSDDPHRPHEIRPATGAPSQSRTVTTTDPACIPVEDDGFRFLLQAQLAGVVSLRRGPEPDAAARAATDAVTLAAADGSHAAAYLSPDAPGAHWRVVQSGPRRLWDSLTATYALWLALDEPGPGRFGVVANLSQEFLWLDSDEGWLRWPLPLV